MRIYLVGAGVISRTHVAAARKLPESVQFRVADVSSHALEGFAEVYPDIPPFADTTAMLTSEPPRDDDIVIIATPPFAHLEPTLEALQSGRHVLCEKPLAMTAEDADRMLAAADAAGRLLGCCSVRFRGLPHNETVKRVLASGVLGGLHHLTWVNKWARSRSGIEYQPGSSWFLDSSKSGGGILMDWGPYDIATLTDLFAPTAIGIEAVAIARPETSADPSDVVFDVETAASAAMVLDRDEQRLLVSYQRASAMHGEEVFRAELEGTRGSLRWTPFDSRADVVLRTDEGEGPVERVIEPEPRAPYEAFDYPIIHFAAAVAGRPNLALVGRDAVANFHWVRAMYDVARDAQPRRVELGGARERVR
jgi:predicted dehydrogenase